MVMPSKRRFPLELSPTPAVRRHLKNVNFLSLVPVEENPTINP
jgi:hypothetical protein